MTDTTSTRPQGFGNNACKKCGLRHPGDQCAPQSDPAAAFASASTPTENEAGDTNTKAHGLIHDLINGPPGTYVSARETNDWEKVILKQMREYLTESASLSSRARSTSVTGARSSNVENDELYKLLLAGKADAECQKDAAAWIKDLHATPPAHGEGELEINRLIWKIILDEKGPDEPLVHGPNGTCWIKQFTVTNAVHKISKELAFRRLLDTTPPAEGELREALIEARKALVVASRTLTEDCKIVLNGKQWGEGTFATIDRALSHAPSPPQQDGSGLVEAAEAAQSWLDNWAQHVGLCPDGQVCTCGLDAVRAELNTALASASQPTQTEEKP